MVDWHRDDDADTLIEDATLPEFFRKSVDHALNNQKIDADEHTVFYIVNLLDTFTSSDELYERTPDGRDLKPLALIFSDALEATSGKDRSTALRRLGDLSLYVAGFFSSSLSRKVVDVDYYISMGGSAYDSLSDMVRSTVRGEVFAEIFGELARKFPAFVDVLSEVSERANVTSDRDILRLYDLWIKTGSKRYEEKLGKLGIHPTEDAKSKFRH